MFSLSIVFNVPYQFKCELIYVSLNKCATVALILISICNYGVTEDFGNFRP